MSIDRSAGTGPRVEVRTDRRSVLPWRRHHVDAELAPLLDAYLERHRRADTDADRARLRRRPRRPRASRSAARASPTSRTRSAWR